jgi:hypothetical protein
MATPSKSPSTKGHAAPKRGGQTSAPNPASGQVTDRGNNRCMFASVDERTDRIIDAISNNPYLGIAVAQQMYDGVWKQFLNDGRKRPRSWVEISVIVLSRFLNLHLLVAAMLRAPSRPTQI